MDFIDVFSDEEDKEKVLDFSVSYIREGDKNALEEIEDLLFEGQ